MYEEIDDTYRTKLQQYMRAQNMQLSRDFDNSLLAGFTPSAGGMPSLQMPASSQGMQMQQPQLPPAASPSFSASLKMPTLTQNLPSMHIRPRGSHSGPRGGHHHNPQRRASSVAPAGPIHAGRKMSLDLTQLRSGSIPGSISAPSTDLTAPSGSFSPSYPTPGPIQAQAQMPAYVASTPTYAVRPQQQQQQQQHQHQQQLMQTWDGLFQGHAMSPSSSFGGIPMHTPQFRNRIGSAPTIPVRAQAQALSQAQNSNVQHSRNRSEPTPSAEVPTPSSSSSSFSLGFFPRCASNSDSTSTEMLTTSGSTSPHTPVSQASTNLRHNLSSLDLTDSDPKFDADQQLQNFDLHLGLGAFPHQSTDQDFVDFSDFAATLDQSHTMFPFNFAVPGDSGSLTADAAFGDGPDMKEFVTL